MTPFKFLSNHALVLLCISENPEVRIRDIAHDLEITERATQRIVGDLVEAGYLARERVGRRNRYALADHLPVSLPVRRVVTLSSLLSVLAGPTPAGASLTPAGAPLQERVS